MAGTEASYSLMESGSGGGTSHAESHHDCHSGRGSLDVEGEAGGEEGEDEKEPQSIQQQQCRRGRWAGLFSGELGTPLPSTTLPVAEGETKSFLRRTGAKVFDVCVFLLPSFLQPRRSGAVRGGSSDHAATATDKKEKPLHPTAYLDGLRGVAALVVYIFHFGYMWFPFLRDGYGAPGSDNSFWQITGVRVFHSGRGSVTLFFVLSGYVVTAKTVALIHRNQQRQREAISSGQPQKEQEVAHGHAQVLLSLSGSLFRRPFRLYLPIVASTLIILALTCLDGTFPEGTGPPHIEGGIGAQFAHWLEHTGHLVNPFRSINGRAGTYSPPYDGHLWTIPVEFKGSLTVFALLLALAGVSGARLPLGPRRMGVRVAGRWIRIAAEVVAGCWQVKMGDFDQALFCAGLFLVEMSLIIPPSSLSSPLSSSCETTPPTVPEATEVGLPPLPPRGLHFRGRRPTAASVRTWLRHAWTLALFALAVHLLGWPETKGPYAPGYRMLSDWVPEAYGGEERIQQFWISVGAIFFVLALMYSPPVGRLRPRWADRLGATCQRNAACVFRDVVRAAYPGFRSSEPESCFDGDEYGAEKDRSRPEEPLLQRPFTTRFALYLGRISYALYLAHGAVNDAVCTRFLRPAQENWAKDLASYNDLREVIDAAYGGHDHSDGGNEYKYNYTYDDEVRAADATLSKAYLRYCIQAAIAALVNTLVLIWVSDVFWRAVDARSVTVTRRLWAWASGSGPRPNSRPAGT